MPTIRQALRRQQRDQLRAVKVWRYYEFFPWLVAAALGLLLWEWKTAYVPSPRNDRTPSPAAEGLR